MVAPGAVIEETASKKSPRNQEELAKEFAKQNDLAIEKGKDTEEKPKVKTFAVLTRPLLE